MTTMLDRMVLHGKPEQINTVIGAKIIVADTVARSLVYMLDPDFEFIPQQQRLFIEYQPSVSFLKSAYRIGFVVDLAAVTDDIAAMFDKGLMYCVVMQAFIEPVKRVVMGPELLGIFGFDAEGNLVRHSNGQFGEIHVLDESRLRGFMDEGIISGNDLDTYTMLFYVPMTTLIVLHRGRATLEKCQPDKRLAKKIQHQRGYQMKAYYVMKVAK